MKQGIIMISVDVDKTTDPRNPYRTGGWCVVTDAYVSKVLQAEVALPLLKNRVAFVPDDVWDEVGLPRGSM
jgi:hypothetical protein